MCHVGYNIVQYPLVSDARLLLLHEDNWTTLAQSSSDLGINIWDGGVRISILLATTPLPAASMVCIVLGAFIPPGNIDSKFAEAVCPRETLCQQVEVIISKHFSQLVGCQILDDVGVVLSMDPKEAIIFFGVQVVVVLQPGSKSGQGTIPPIHSTEEDLSWGISFLHHILGPAHPTCDHVVLVLLAGLKVGRMPRGRIINTSNSIELDTIEGCQPSTNFLVIMLGGYFNSLLKLLSHKSSPSLGRYSPTSRLHLLHGFEKLGDLDATGGVASSCNLIPWDVPVQHVVRPCLLP